MKVTHEQIAAADTYLARREGCYEYRCKRYDAALTVMHNHALSHADTVVDVGSGWGEFGVRLHTRIDTEAHWWGTWPSRARYIPVDAAIDGTDLERWVPPRQAEWFVALEVIEHLNNPQRLLTLMKGAAREGVIVSTPNPETTDVLGMDPTHRSVVRRGTLETNGFDVQSRQFYGKPGDSLFGVWLRGEP